MAYPAINTALIVAAQKGAASAEALLDQLRKGGAIHTRAAMPLDVSADGAPEMLAYLVKRGQVRSAGGERYWLDEEAIARGKAAGARVAFILIAFLASAGASLLAIAAR